MTDTGPGMSEDFQRTMFVPFAQEGHPLQSGDDFLYGPASPGVLMTRPDHILRKFL